MTLRAACLLLCVLATVPRVQAGEESPAPAPWLDGEGRVQVGADGRARSIYTPEFRGAPWLKEQLAQQAPKGLAIELITPFVAVAPKRKFVKFLGEFEPAPKETVAGRLLLRGPEGVVRSARTLLRGFDTAPRAVFVSLLVCEVRRTRDHQRGGSVLFDGSGGIGQDAAFFRATSGSFEPDAFLRSSLTGMAPFEGTTLRFVDDDVSGLLEYTLRLLERQRDAEFLAWPNLLCNEGETAAMTVTRLLPKILLAESAPGNPQIKLAGDEEAGLKLKVTALRVGSETAVLDLDVWLRLPEEVHDPGAPPGLHLRFKRRQVTTRITVRDRQPLMLGGLVLKHRQRGRHGLPRPKELSFLDPLHSSALRSARETEIVFLVRPRVFPGQTRPAELHPATYRAWTKGRLLPNPWSGAKSPGADPPGARR